MQLHGSVAYDPSTAANKATTSASVMAVLDSTNITLSITVPAHGKVLIKMRTVLDGATTMPQVLLGVMNHSGGAVLGRVTPMGALGGTALATTHVPLQAEFIITGLTPGAIQLDAAFGVELAVASTAIRWGGPNNTVASDAWGAFVFEAWDPQSEPPNFTLASIDANGRLDIIKIAGTTQTARDIGASVLLSTGTGAGQLDFTSGVVKANATQWLGGTIPAVTVTGVPLVDCRYLLGTAFATPATAGIIDANVKNINNTAAATPGASGGVLISGSNAGTTTLGALTVTGVTTHTGATVYTANVSYADGITVAAPSTTDRAGLSITGNGAGAGIIVTGGATGNGVTVSAGATSGHGIISTATGTSNNGLKIVGSPTTGDGLLAVGGSTSGNGVSITTTSGHGISSVATGTTKHGIHAAGGATTSHGLNLVGGGAGHGLLATSGSGATGDGMQVIAASSLGCGLRAVASGAEASIRADSSSGSGYGIRATSGGSQAALRLDGSVGIGIASTNTGISISTSSDGDGIAITTTGTNRHGIVVTGGNAGTCDGMKLNPGTGGVALRAPTITGTITGNLVGTVSTLTTYTGNTVQTGDSFARIGSTGSGLTSLASAANLATVQSDTDDIQSRLPAALVSGRIDASVGAMAAAVLTAAAIAADAITDAKVASDVTIASVTGSVGSVVGGVGSVTGAVGSVTGNVGGNVVGSVGSVTAGVTVTTNNDKTGYGLSSAAVQAIWDALTSALTTVGSVGKLLVDKLDAAVSSRMATYTQPTGFLATTFPATVASTTNITAGTITTVSGNVTGSVGSVTGLTASDVGTIKLQTDQLVFTKSNELDVNIQSVNDVTVNGVGSAGSPWGP